jgi:hypothetical protein
MSNLFSQAGTYLAGKEWDIYPFIHSFFSLLLSLVLIPIYERLLDDRLNSFLTQKGLGQNFDLVKAITTTRGLQIAYLTEVPVFAVSLIASVQANHPILLVILVILGILLIITIPPGLFISDPDFLILTPFPRNRKPRFLAERNWTQKDFYSTLLVLLNLLFLVILVILLPGKSVVPQL